MKKITIEELVNLVKGKFWNIETELDFNFYLSMETVIITVCTDSKTIAFTKAFPDVHVALATGEAMFSIEDYTEAVEEIEYNDNKIVIRFLNFPDLVISECN